MAHDYRMLQHWNQWLTHQYLGTELLAAEQAVLSQMLNRHFGKHALLIGVPAQSSLFESTQIPCHSLITPLLHSHARHIIESDLRELPIITGSVDLVLLPHTLEFVSYPRQLLSEACRVIKPEGVIVITGFNPISLWGLRKWFLSVKKPAWCGHFLSPSHINNWLQLADFALEQQETFFYRPPITHSHWYQRLHFLEKIGKLCLPKLGGVYAIEARAKVIPLTPIKMKWRQQLGSLPISGSMTGHIIR